jgi:hypothetical protein
MRMKKLLALTLLLFTFSLKAQAPVAVPIPKEPHHHLVLENDYVRVFRVSVPAHEATLLHQHDVPYIYVSLGPADVINAVQGKPQARLVMADGQVGYSRGGFAHIARNQSDAPFNNVTIELLKRQGEPRNLCAKIVEGPAGECPNPESAPTSTHPAPLPRGSLLFETDEFVVESGALTPNPHYAYKQPAISALLVTLEGAELNLKLSRIVLPDNERESAHLRGGEVYWLPAGVKRSISARGKAPARILLFSFKDSGPASPLTGQTPSKVLAPGARN